MIKVPDASTGRSVSLGYRKVGDKITKVYLDRLNFNDVDHISNKIAGFAGRSAIVAASAIAKTEAEVSAAPETWEAAVLGVIAAHKGVILLQEIYRQMENHPLVEPRHKVQWGGQPNYHHWIRSAIAKLKRRRAIRHIGRSLYILN